MKDRISGVENMVDEIEENAKYKSSWQKHQENLGHYEKITCNNNNNRRRLIPDQKETKLPTRS